MNKDETIYIMDMIRFKLRAASADLISVGKYSDHIYQAKCDRYANQIDTIIIDILEDGCNDIE